MENLILIENEEQIEQILNNNKFVIIDFFAQWCGPCRALMTVLDSLASQNENIVFCKVDVDNESVRDFAIKHGVRSLPTINYFKDTEKVGVHVGFMSKSEFSSEIELNFFN